MNFIGAKAELRAIFIMEFMVPDGYILLSDEFGGQKIYFDSEDKIPCM